MRTIGDLSRLNGRRYPDKTALILGDQTLTYRALDRQSNQLAHLLIAAGVARGDRVAVLSYNRLEYAVITQAVAKVGAILVPINFRLTAAELGHILADASPKVLVHEARFNGALDEAAASVDAPPTRIVIDGEGAETLAAALAGRPETQPAIDVSEHDPCVIIYTSGTTGRPKGVLVSHATYFRMYLATAVEADLRHDDIFLLAIPMFHAAGLNMALHQSLFLGATGVIHAGSFDPPVIAALVDQAKVTIAILVPTTIAMMARSEGVRAYDLSSLRRVFYGAMPMTTEGFTEARALFPKAGFVQIYGSTETGMASILRPPEHVGDLKVTGREALLSEIRIVNEAGQDIGPGEIGEIIVRQASMGMIGYWNNPQATAETIRDGWIYSGDLAVLGDDGLFLIVGRTKEVIISGGENIYPREVEEVLVQHPAVLDAAVFGAPDPVYGETAVAALVLRRGQSVAAGELVAFCRARLAGYKAPRAFDLYDEFPRNASDKVRKDVLRANHAGTEQARLV